MLASYDLCSCDDDCLVCSMTRTFSPPVPPPPTQRPKKSDKWTQDRKQRHKLSCRNKSRLSLQDKMDIVSLFYSTMPSSSTQVVTQSSIAKMYGKSRSAICKVLKSKQVEALLRKVVMAGQGLPAGVMGRERWSEAEALREAEMPRVKKEEGAEESTTRAYTEAYELCDSGRSDL
ncbi:hypothetical protein GUITHDRAFT_104218 [Guillardia theta CCMP2712]|uniref:Uncharacterized protein n=1 Tax=Guillardia theta (strain CCMP2712) TaxID=905079 RepID=L1JNI9_GUITC|nr:hypothetical protein GUITHDRAFT_104218 [Guillardia theta CCMP2712]EKX49824.1 hypothetical protein GUITHDRAFT_104218 [Guillardia theta CCMP2712]|eukprot:XP_005836804.1 hypothetical protein GUITHDRAFT_104218 [Guillardia theta CCMP2712]